MPDHTKNDNPGNGMQCQEFDGLLSDALDGVLTGAQLNAFRAHTRICSACGPLFAEVEAGRNWLKELKEAEAPASLVNRILASTSGIETQRLWGNVGAPQRRGAGAASWTERAQALVSGFVSPVWSTVRQPRFAMSFGMSFFALSVGLTVMGVKPADLREVSLRPAAIRHTYYNAQARVVRYYENIRFVYEVESRVRELKRNVTPAEPGSGESTPEKKDHKNDTTQQPEQKQDRNYSQSGSQLILASAGLDSMLDQWTLQLRTLHQRTLNQSTLNQRSLHDPSVAPVVVYRRLV